jgi:hypothetical protein
LTRAVRGYRRGEGSGIDEPRRGLEHLHFREGPHEPFYGLQDRCDVTCVSGYRREPQLGSLPLVLIPDFGGGNLVAAAGAFENRLDERPLLLEGVTGRKEEGDVEGPYVRGISRSS